MLSDFLKLEKLIIDTHKVFEKKSEIYGIFDIFRKLTKELVVLLTV